MNCEICSEVNVGPDHEITEKHIRNKMLFDYSLNRKQFAGNRKGVVVTCSVKSTLASLVDFPDGKIKISAKPKEEIKFVFTIKNDTKKEEISVIFIQLVHNMLSFTINDHDMSFGSNPVLMGPKTTLQKEVSIVFKSSDIGQYEMPIVFSFRKPATNESVLIMRDMVVFVEEKQTVHEKIASPYAQKEVMADKLFKTTLADRSDDMFRIPRNYKSIYASSLKTKEDATKDERDLCQHVREIFMTGVTEENYIQFFHNLLWYEETIVRINLKNYNMSAVPLVPQGDGYALIVPGLGEKRPSLMLGDLLFVKPHNNQDVMFEAVITEIQDNVAHIRGLHDDFRQYHRQYPTFDVRFFMSRLPLERMHQAVHSVTRNGPEQRRVFPQPNKNVRLVKHIKNYFNPLVEANVEQRCAVEHIVSGTSGLAPYLVHGPPGTGKTVTVVEAILQLVTASPKTRVMVCTDSNMAADHVATMILRYTHLLAGDKLLLRANSKFRVWETLPESLHKYSNGHSRETFSSVSTTDFMAYRIVVTTLSHAAKFAKDFKTKRMERPITHLFIDEAAQASEPACLIPTCGLLSTRGALIFFGSFEGKRRREMEKEKIVFKGSHPDSLYRVPSHDGAGAGRMVRMMRLLRWPAALIVVCVALAVFVYFLMPSNMDADRAVNSTDWEVSAASVGGQLRRVPDKLQTRPAEKKQDAKHKSGSKTPEIDFYDPENGKNDVLPIIDAITDKSPNRKLPIAPVFPSRITPEVQYGDTDKLRGPKLIDETNTISSDSTVKPHITQRPEKPLAIYFKDATTTTESITKAESVNDFTTFEEKQTTKKVEDLYAKRFPAGYKTLPAREPINTNGESESAIPIQIQEFYNRHPATYDVKFTSGHSKLFGISIEDAEKMRSTTQSSVYHTRVSPTLPTWRDEDTTTKKYPVINADVSQCHSPRLSLCRGVLPYDLAGAPAIVSGRDITALMPQIEFLVASNCSERVRQFVCTLLEPECSPPPYPAKLPCYNLCQAIVDTCDGFVPRELIPTFNCRQYARTECVGARAPCSQRERQCGDGTCILSDWVCDGTRDCPGGEDEESCATCDRDEFRCSTGSCIPKQWLCDGYLDCPKGDDEVESACPDRDEPRVSEPGEESSGSAPAPSVRKPNRLPESRYRGNTHRSDDSSKELLETSDSSNALRRNFTRRPSPSRLTPYRPKLRHPPPTTPQAEEEPEEEKETEKPKKVPVVRPKPKRTTTTTTPKPLVNQAMVNDHESSEDINIADLGFFEELGTDDKDNDMKEGAKVQVAAPQSQNMRRMTNAANAPNVPQAQDVKEPEQRPMHKIPSKVDTVIDGAAMLRKAAQKEAEESKPDPKEQANSNFERFDDIMPGKGTSHSSPCPSGELRCVDGRCITLAQLCDGTIDCTDHADEDNCYT